jgi:nucleoside-diphosphate-sugar epimerase
VAEGSFRIYGGQQWRPFISVQDICRGLIQVLSAERKKVNREIFNLGDSRENYRLIEIGDFIKGILPEVKIELARDETDKRNYRVSFEKIKNHLGFTAEFTITDTIEDLVSAYREEEMFREYNDPRYHNHLCL